MLVTCFLNNRWDFDETWGYTHGEVVGETGVSCDWSKVRAGTLDMPTCTKSICGGHNENDLLPFEVKVILWCDDAQSHILFVLAPLEHLCCLVLCVYVIHVSLCLHS